MLYPGLSGNALEIIEEIDYIVKLSSLLFGLVSSRRLAKRLSFQHVMLVRSPFLLANP